MNCFLLYFIDSAKTHRRGPRTIPCKEAPGCEVFSSIKTMPLEGETAPSWWGCLCAVCFAGKKSSERELFVPAGTHLGVKLLMPMPMHHYFFSIF
jgi:hypothetical protein